MHRIDSLPPSVSRSVVIAVVWRSLWPIVYVIVLPILLFLLLALYAALMTWHEELLQDAISTATLIYAHGQTLRLLARLEITWPQGVRFPRTHHTDGTNGTCTRSLPLAVACC